jgi:hypothetical protein
VFLSCVFINFIFVFLTSGQDYNSGMQKRIHFRTDMEHNICRPVNNSDVFLGYQFCENITFILYIIYNVRYNKYGLIHGHFHISLVIIPRPPYWPETESRTNMGRGMITRPIWKCPCIKLFITYFRYLEKRHLKRSRGPGVKIWTVYFRSYWSHKNAFI